LQQGTVDGQENPITNIASQNLQEVQSDLSLTAHQLNTNLVLIGDVWNEFDEEQQQVVSDAVAMAVDEVTACVDEEDAATIEEWDAGDEWDVHSDVDVDAFREQDVSWFEPILDEDMLTVIESIRATAPRGRRRPCAPSPRSRATSRRRRSARRCCTSICSCGSRTWIGPCRMTNGTR